MKKTSTKNAKLKQRGPDIELDFAHSRAGLGTHKKNCTEQTRLENKLRALEIRQRRSVQIHEDEQREILQRLTANHEVRTPSVSLSRLGDPGEMLLPGDFISTPRFGRRGSLQPEYLTSFSRQKDPTVESVGITTLTLPARSRRPSVILQGLSTQPVIDLSSPESRSSLKVTANDTIIDMVAASNRARKGRRGSVGGIESEAGGADDRVGIGLRAEIGGGGGGGRRRRRGSIGGDPTPEIRETGTGTNTSKEGGAGQRLTGRQRRQSIAGGLAPEFKESGTGRRRRSNGGEEGEGEDPADKPQRPRRYGEDDVIEQKKPTPSLTRGRRPSLDVGVANLSLLSPGGSPVARGPMSRLAVRRSSAASSQDTPSTPSTPDSKSRDGYPAFTFPPAGAALQNNTSSPIRHSSDVRPRLHRRHSSDSLIQSSPTSHRLYVTPVLASQGHHRRNSSLKLPRMQGKRRKSVTPCVSRMVLLHNVLQNSSAFQVPDVEEGT